MQMMRKIVNYDSRMRNHCKKNSLSRPKIKEPSHQGRDWSGCFLIPETGLEVGMLWGKGRCLPKLLEVHIPAVEEAEMKLSSLSFCPLYLFLLVPKWVEN